MIDSDRRLVLGAAVLWLLALSLAASVAAPAKTVPPRFALSIHGTQRFEWAIDGGLDEISGSAACAFKGRGVQTIEFATPPGLIVVPTEIWSPSGAPGGKEFRALLGGKQRRLLPLAGKESRDYQALVAPQVTACPLFRGLAERGYGKSCQGANPFKAGSGVVLIRNGERLELHTPVDVLLYDRRPAACDLRLFDLRNSIMS